MQLHYRLTSKVMKTRNLFLFVLLVLSFACEDKIEKPLVSAKSANDQPLAAPMKGGNTKGGNTAGRLGVAKFYAVSNQWGGAQWSWKGDFNGDKKWDVISVTGTTAYLKLSGGEFGSYTCSTWSTNGEYSSVPAYNFTGDFNGDGLTDIASAIGNTVKLKLNNYPIAGFVNLNCTVGLDWGVASNTLVGDYNGDGHDDIASYLGTNVYMKLYNGGEFTSVTWPNAGSWGPNGWTRAMDYNGDGLTDLVSINGGQLYAKRSYGGGFDQLTFSTANTWGSSGYTWGSGGHNSFGQIFTAIAGNIYVRTFNGSSWTFETYATSNWWGNDGYNWLEDFNNADDFDVVSAQGGQIYVH